jgi:hypothetical protein
MVPLTAVPSVMRYSSNYQTDLLQGLTLYLVYRITAGTAVIGRYHPPLQYQKLNTTFATGHDITVKFLLQVLHVEAVIE